MKSGCALRVFSSKRFNEIRIAQMIIYIISFGIEGLTQFYFYSSLSERVEKEKKETPETCLKMAFHCIITIFGP